ncbi:di/tri peptide transporter 2 [Saitoella complicata NRRL Y-17804]|uniref:di/tri peptide transporter 2 n=1 Tax=Saitoella complicata (strain BCRC 22490 / CBS 7301 / JCM 7358 / NBRC 10748 / NRRL Y-17804) TaxID=698492 RepID=UPI0008670E20|nr:di/tri peptide transporter 2 [Saitoella complicata NRRL Y-17804]ODQ49734.1 di/tri peptide transporter 2 [Saitoella complicata NRRL Y-17804]
MSANFDIAGGSVPVSKEGDRDKDVHGEFVRSASTVGSGSVDELEDGEVEPTEEELSTLRRVSDNIPLSAWFVVVVELCERFAYYGLSGPFQNYIQFPYNNGDLKQPGAIGLGQQGATALSQFFQFWCYVTPILGAIVADQYIGKYKTISLFCAFYMVGLLVLVCTSVPSAIRAGSSLGGIITAMIVIGLGTGGIKSNVSPMVAEQYRRTRRVVKTLKNGERVIVDPAITIQRIFMVFYWCINVGSLSAIATTELEHHKGFWQAYLLPLCVFFIAILFLVIGKPYYVTRPPTGSVVLRAFQAGWIAICNGGKLEAAKPSVPAGRGFDKWKQLWDDQFIDELKRALVACRIFIAYPFYWVCYGQMTNNLVSQAATMQTNGVPNDLLQNFDPIALIIFIPICDQFLYPFLRKVGIPFKPISRITVGFFMAALAMAYAAIIQHVIYSSGPNYEYPSGASVPNNVNVWLQIPAYVLIAFSEIFASITGLEYAFTKAPPSMKSFIMSMFLLTNAFGAAINIGLSTVAVDPKLVWMYTGISAACAIAGAVFWLSFRHYNKIEDEMNALEGKREGAVAVGKVEQVHPSTGAVMDVESDKV